MKFKSLLAIVAVSTLLISCDEDDLTAAATETEAKLGEYLVEAESYGNNIYKIIDEALRDSTFLADDSTTINGATVTANGSMISIDYGTGGSYQGKTFEGALDLTQTGGNDILMSGYKVTGMFNGFKIDGQDVTGTFSVENVGNNTFDIDFVNTSFNSEFSTSLDKSITWVNGITTPNDNSDDRYQISGSANGAIANTNDSVSANITTPFDFDKACMYGIVEGVMSVDFFGDSITYDNGIIDFRSADSCNNIYDLQLTGSDGSNINLPLIFNGF